MSVGDWLTPLFALGTSLIAGFFTYRASTTAARTSLEVKQVEMDAVAAAKRSEVEAAAFERARSIYESGIARMEQEIQQLRAQMNEERDVSNQLRSRVNSLEDTVAWMRRQLIIAGIDVAKSLPEISRGPQT